MGVLTSVTCFVLGWQNVIFSENVLLYWNIIFWPTEGVTVYPGTLVSKAVYEEGRVKIMTEDGKEVCIYVGVELHV